MLGTVASVAATSLEQGLIFAFMAMGVLLSFRMLGFPDLTVEGSFPFGGAVAARLLVGGVDPLLATVAGMLAGALAGISTGLIHTKLRINNILAGILVTAMIYTLMLRVMGRPNTPLLAYKTVFDTVPSWFSAEATIISGILLLAVTALAVRQAMGWFLHTDLGLAIRATGNNEKMITSLGVDTDLTKVITLAVSNGLVALSGALVAQNQGFSDIGMGIGALVVAIASIIVGETLMGERSISWTLTSILVGSIVYRALLTAALRVGVAPTDLKLITALLVLGALSAPILRMRLLGRETIQGATQ